MKKQPGTEPESEPEPDRPFGDTPAWLAAAFQVVGPVLLALVATITLVYAVIHLLFLG